MVPDGPLGGYGWNPRVHEECGRHDDRSVWPFVHTHLCKPLEGSSTSTSSTRSHFFTLKFDVLSGVQADSCCQPFQGTLVFTVRHVAWARPLEGPQVAMKRRDHLALHLQESSGLLLAPLKYGEPAGDPWRGPGVLALYSLDASIFALNL